jgi:hypothetical protein
MKPKHHYIIGRDDHVPIMYQEAIRSEIIIPPHTCCSTMITTIIPFLKDPHTTYE